MTLQRYLLLCLCLATCLPACGDPHYRLEGQVDPAIVGIPPRIALLDSTASLKISALHALYKASSDSLAQSVSDSLARIDATLAGMDAPIKKAERHLRSARNSYAQAFKSMERHVSFGGNSVFGRADVSVRTKTLLEEIQDRFYKGKAFSLETGSEIRRTIREKLVPAERRVDNAQQALRKLRSARKAAERRRLAVEQAVSSTRSELVDAYNRRVLDRIEGGVLLETDLDSTRSYRFNHLAAGRYHLFLRAQNPRLMEVELDGHRRILIGPASPSPMMDPPD